MDNGQDPAQYVHCYLSLRFFTACPETVWLTGSQSQAWCDLARPSP